MLVARREYAKKIWQMMISKTFSYSLWPRTCKSPEREHQQPQEPADRCHHSADALQEAVANRLEGATEVLRLQCVTNSGEGD